MPYNADGMVNINNGDNENARNWQTLSVGFTVADDEPVTIGFDCPKWGDSSLGGFQVDNVRLFLTTSVPASVHPLPISLPSPSHAFYSLSGTRLTALPDSGVVICKEGFRIHKLYLR